MKLSELSDKQIMRLYTRLYNRVTKDQFGADWPTLRIVNRALYNSLTRVNNDIVRRWNEPVDHFTDSLFNLP